MPGTIGEELNEVFEKASLSYLSNTLKFDRDHAEFDAILQTAAEKREVLIVMYREDYDHRFEETRARLLDLAAQMKLNHPPPPGGGDDKSGAINSEAHRQVQLAHAADLKEVRDEQQQSLEDLLDRAHRRNQAHGMAREDFRMVCDRRSGHDRRTIKPSHD